MKISQPSGRSSGEMSPKSLVNTNASMQTFEYVLVSMHSFALDCKVCIT